MRDVCEKYEEDFKTSEKLERNFIEIIVKYEKNLNFFLESFKRKVELLVSRMKTSRKFKEKMKKKNWKEFKRNKIKLIELKNRKK